MKHNVLKSDQSLTRKWICALILLLCAFNASQVLGKNDKSKLRIEKLGDKYIYTIGEMRNVFSASFDSASYFTDDNLAIVYDSSSYSNYDSDHSYSSGSSSNTNKVRANDKCDKCLGTGDCISIHSKSKLFCGGNGKCQYCNGSGVIHVAGAPDVFCTNCDRNHNGKCKTCHGTGKCSKCHGSGLKN